MSPSEVAIGMEFQMLDISSYWVVVEGIDGEDALCQYFTCFSGGREKVKLKHLVCNPFGYARYQENPKFDWRKIIEL